MTKQVTKKQHFAPVFYFKRFAVDNFLQTLDIQNGKIIKPQPYSGVCYADFFYAVETGKEDETSQEFEAFFGEIEDRFAKEYDNIVDAIWDYRPLTDQQLDILAWFMASLWMRSPKMREQVNKMMSDGLKQVTSLMASHPNFMKGTKEGLAQEGHVVTDEQIEETRKMFENGEFEINFTNNVNHLNLITNCEEYQRWFFIKKWRFYLAKGSKKFMTSDTPVIEMYNRGDDAMFKNHIAQRHHYFALTPDILIELINPLQPGKKQKRHAIKDDRFVTEVNRNTANYSKAYAYAPDKEYLEDLLQFYEGPKKP